MSQSTIQRRARQIEGYLSPMRRRVLAGAGDSFMSFVELPAKKKRLPRGIRRLRPSAKSETVEDGPWTRIKWFTCYGNDPFMHYVQFAFDERQFRMDLPENTLHPDEAERLLVERTGFFWLRGWSEAERPERGSLGPLNKIYAYGEEYQAALDMLFLLLDVWRFSPNFRWYVNSCPFENGDDWEKDVVMA